MDSSGKSSRCYGFLLLVEEGGVVGYPTSATSSVSKTLVDVVTFETNYVVVNLMYLTILIISSSLIGSDILSMSSHILSTSSSQPSASFMVAQPYSHLSHI